MRADQALAFESCQTVLDAEAAATGSLVLSRVGSGSEEQEVGEALSAHRRRDEVGVEARSSGGKHGAKRRKKGGESRGNLRREKSPAEEKSAPHHKKRPAHKKGAKPAQIQ